MTTAAQRILARCPQLAHRLGAWARSNRRVPVLSLMVLGSVLLVSAGSSAATRTPTRPHAGAWVRWDIARYVRREHALVPEGRSTWRARSGATITITGTGQAQPDAHVASGGGLWVRRSAGGRVIGHGTYAVLGVRHWQSAGGSLVANVTDTIANAVDGRNGLLVLDVRLDGAGGGGGVLTLSSAAALPPTHVAAGSLEFHSRSGAEIRYRESTTPGGQVLVHLLR